MRGEHGDKRKLSENGLTLQTGGPRAKSRG